MSQNKAFIFCIGRELLEGLVLDRNANFMAGKLSQAGCHVVSIQVLDNDEKAMVEAFQNALSRRPGYIFTTGGMGPGHNDITRQCVAKAAGLSLKPDDRATEMVAKSYRRLAAKGVVEEPDLNDSRRRMAELPEGAECYENPIGTAPAVRLRAKDTLFFLMPGVPHEMQHMFDLYVTPALEADGKGTHKKSATVDFPGRDESALSRVLADVERRYPGLVAQARPRESEGIRITLLAEHADSTELESSLERAEADLRARLGLEIQRREPPTQTVSD